MAMPHCGAVSCKSPESGQIIAAQSVTIEQQDATVRNLRTRLDREADEHRHLIAC
jgi:hypothetical protein